MEKTVIQIIRRTINTASATYAYQVVVDGKVVKIRKTNREYNWGCVAQYQTAKGIKWDMPQMRKNLNQFDKHCNPASIFPVTISE
jgi:predicted RNA-binding protein with PUA domain